MGQATPALRAPRVALAGRLDRRRHEAEAGGGQGPIGHPARPGARKRDGTATSAVGCSTPEARTALARRLGGELLLGLDRLHLTVAAVDTVGASFDGHSELVTVAELGSGGVRFAWEDGGGRPVSGRTAALLRAAGAAEFGSGDPARADAPGPRRLALKRIPALARRRARGNPGPAYIPGMTSSA